MKGECFVKKILSLLLVLVTVITVFMTASCSSQIALESSESSSDSPKAEFSDFLIEYAQENYGIALKDEKDKLTYNGKSLVTGTKDDALEYGVDISSIVEGGYIIRGEDGNWVVFAPDKTGLDNGISYFARRYMNENGFLKESVYIAETGYRVKKLTIAGNDISLYTIKVPEVMDGDITVASADLQQYIEKTCGVKLNISSNTSSQYIIELKKDSSAEKKLGKESFHITSDGKKLTIEGGYKRGCTYGVFELMESYVGWRFVRPDTYYLYESEHVDIPAGIDDLQSPSFDYRDSYGGIYDSKIYPNAKDMFYKVKGNGENLRSELGSEMLKSVHGLRRFGFPESMTCFTDPEVIEKARSGVKKYVAERLAAGAQIGIDFHCVDVSKTDTFDNCSCKNCRVYMKKYNNALSAPMMEFVNIIARDVQKQAPGLRVTTLAYAGLEKPCTGFVAEDNVNVSFCFYIPDNAHHLSGDNGPENCRNKYLADYFIGWTEIAPVDVWYYTGDWMYDIAAAPIVTNIYYDIKFLSQYNTRGVFFMGGNTDYTAGNQLADYMVNKMLWNSDISYEEFEACCKEWMRIMYGEGYETVWGYYLTYEEAAHIDSDNCWSALKDAPQARINIQYVRDHYDQWWDMYMYSRSLCQNVRQQKNLELFFFHMNFLGVSFSHTPRYLNGSTEDRAIIAERYTHLYHIIKKYNIHPTAAWDIDNGDFPDELDLNLNPLMTEGIPKKDMNGTWNEDFLK